MNIEIAQCPMHPGFWAIMLVEHSSGYCDRITPSECCGNWRLVHKWPVGRDDVDGIIRQLKVFQKHQKKRDRAQGRKE